MLAILFRIHVFPHGGLVMNIQGNPIIRTTTQRGNLSGMGWEGIGSLLSISWMTQFLHNFAKGCQSLVDPQINDLVKDCSYFSTLALELLQSCAKPSKSKHLLVNIRYEHIMLRKAKEKFVVYSNAVLILPGFPDMTLQSKGIVSKQLAGRME